METNSQKPKEWVGIPNEPNYRFATIRVKVLLFKGLTCLPCLLYLVHVMLYLALPCLVYFALPLPHFVLHCPTLFALPSAMHVLPCYCQRFVIGVVPYFNKLIKHEKVVPVNRSNVCATTLKHQTFAFPFFPSYLLPFPPTHLLFFFLSSICH